MNILFLTKGKKARGRAKKTYIFIRLLFKLAF